MQKQNNRKAVDKTARQQEIATTQRNRELEAHRVARQAAAAEQSDPFTYARVFSHMMNRIGEEHSYGYKSHGETE